MFDLAIEIHSSTLLHRAPVGDTWSVVKAKIGDEVGYYLEGKDYHSHVTTYTPLSNENALLLVLKNLHHLDILTSQSKFKKEAGKYYIFIWGANGRIQTVK